MEPQQGWGIIHPNGHLELDYFYHKFPNAHDNEKWPGAGDSPENFCKAFRPQCRMVRVRVTEIGA